jgi:prephenate dehydrogenase
LRERGLADRVIGIGRRPTSLRAARRAGAVTSTTVDLAKGVAEAALVVVCSPVGCIVDHVRRAAEHCRPSTLITDAGSTKQAIVRAVDGSLSRGCRFLGSHPLAGSEKTGPANARADLFEDRVVILTPTRNTSTEDFHLLERFWTRLGSSIVRMSPEDHDRALAVTSHLPHAVAVALSACLPEDYFRLTGTGFLDTSRVAAGDPELWKQIFLQNRENSLSAIDRFEEHLDALRRALSDGDAEALENLLTTAKNNRDALGN